MKINIGSINTVKVGAVSEIIQDYPHLSDAVLRELQTDSGVSVQPKSLEETIQGAMNRAKNVFDDCDYSIGIESGLMHVPNTKTGYMNVCVCVIFDGKEFHIGLGPAFEYPGDVTRLVFEEGLDIDQAFFKAGLTDNQDIGSAEGVIGSLTKGRITRKEYTK